MYFFPQLITNQTASLKIDSSVRMFPKREYTPPTEYLKNVVSIYMNIAFAPYILFLLTNIVTEKVCIVLFSSGQKSK